MWFSYPLESNMAIEFPQVPHDVPRHQRRQRSTPFRASKNLTSRWTVKLLIILRMILIYLAKGAN